MGIFSALAEKLSNDKWIPPPMWWVAGRKPDDWLNLSPEEKLGAWIAATDYDYIDLAERLLGRQLKKERENEREHSGSAGDHDSTLDQVEDLLDQRAGRWARDDGRRRWARDDGRR